MISEPRLLVTSDPHVGNLFVNARANLVRFSTTPAAKATPSASTATGSTCSTRRSTGSRPEAQALLRELRGISEKTTIYYTVGNHDLILEHYPS